MLLTEINYPIFPIRSYIKLYEKDKIQYIDTANKTWIIDNKNLAGETLAARRFRIPKEERYPLILSIFNLMQLLRYIKGRRFIDSLGNIFTYKKTRYESLKYYKVIGTLDMINNIAVYTEEYSTPFYVTKTDFNMIYEKDKDLFIGLLAYHGGHLFYELSRLKKDDTRRKV